MPFTEQSIEANAPIAGVWSRFSDFHGMSWAPTAEDAVAFCHGVYVALLAELKLSFTP